MATPTAYLRAQRRAADPERQVRDQYRRVMRAAGLRIARWPLTVRWSKAKPLRISGRCYWNRIVLTVGVEVDPSNPEVLRALCHEVAHAKAPHGEGHGDLWRSIYADLRRSVGLDATPEGRFWPAYAAGRSVPAERLRAVHAAALAVEVGRG